MGRGPDVAMTIRHLRHVLRNEGWMLLFIPSMQYSSLEKIT